MGEVGVGAPTCIPTTARPRLCTFFWLRAAPGRTSSTPTEKPWVPAGMPVPDPRVFSRYAGIHARCATRNPDAPSQRAHSRASRDMVSTAKAGPWSRMRT